MARAVVLAATLAATGHAALDGSGDKFLDRRARSEPAQSRERWQLVPPIQRDVVYHGKTQPGYAIELADAIGTSVTFECIAEKGGLITAFRLNGTNVLFEGEGDDAIDGSIFWASPQSAWGWPPPAALNSDKFSAEVDQAAMAVTLTGPVDQGLRVRAVKRFSADLRRGAVVVEYSLVNEGGNQTLAPWEVTRVAPGGLTFFAAGSGAPRGPAQPGFGPIPYTERDGAIWFRWRQEELAENNKLFSDTSAGWLAHVPASGDVVLVKQFERIPPGSAAPGEAQVEIYAAGKETASYEEVELQGAYAPVPNSPSPWTVSWLLRSLPSDVKAAAGSRGLLGFVDGLPRSEPC